MTLTDKNTDRILNLVECTDLIEAYNTRFKPETYDPKHREVISNNKLFITLEFDIRGNVPETALVFPQKIIQDWRDKNFT